MPAKLTEKDYHRVAEEKGCKWVGEFVPTTKERTLWRCQCGREWKTTYGSMVKNAGNCPGCGGTEKKTESDYHLLAEKFGFIFVGPMPESAHSKSTWACLNGHKWETSYVYVNQKYGCPHCYGNVRKTPGDYFLLASEMGIYWLGPEVANVGRKTRWRCHSGHIWMARYDNIKSGFGCPFCARNVQKTTGDYQIIASSRGFTWLGPQVNNIHERTWWQCDKGHKWQTVLASILHQGTGCPKCADFENGQIVSQVQRDLFAMLNHLPKAELNTPYGRLNLDITFEVDEINICVEYDSWYWHKDKLKQDARRDRGLIRDGWRVLRVKSRTKLPSQAQIDAALAELAGGAMYTEIVLDDWGDVDTNNLKQ